LGDSRGSATDVPCGLERTGAGGQDADQVGEDRALPGLSELAPLTERGIGLPDR